MKRGNSECNALYKQAYAYIPCEARARQAKEFLEPQLLLSRLLRFCDGKCLGTTAELLWNQLVDDRTG